MTDWKYCLGSGYDMDELIAFFDDLDCFLEAGQSFGYVVFTTYGLRFYPADHTAADEFLPYDDAERVLLDELCRDSLFSIHAELHDGSLVLVVTLDNDIGYTGSWPN